MRRQMTAGELEDFYRRIGASIWHLQYLEDILVNFLTLKLVHERRCAGGTVAMPEAQAQLAEKRKLTLGPLIESCGSKKIISRERVQRFEAFKAERHWLVHRSMIENSDDLYLASTRNTVFARIAAIQEEARALGHLLFQDLQAWITKHGVSMDRVNRDADHEMRVLQGLDE
jgi:hypothetical protein